MIEMFESVLLENPIQLNRLSASSRMSCDNLRTRFKEILSPRFVILQIFSDDSQRSMKKLYWLDLLKNLYLRLIWVGDSSIVLVFSSITIIFGIIRIIVFVFVSFSFVLLVRFLKRILLCNDQFVKNTEFLRNEVNCISRCQKINWINYRKAIDRYEVKNFFSSFSWSW